MSEEFSVEWMDETPYPGPHILLPLSWDSLHSEPAKDLVKFIHALGESSRQIGKSLYEGLIPAFTKHPGPSVSLITKEEGDSDAPDSRLA